LTGSHGHILQAGRELPQRHRGTEKTRRRRRERKREEEEQDEDTKTTRDLETGCEAHVAGE
jgi:hypothetical protein